MHLIKILFRSYYQKYSINIFSRNYLACHLIVRIINYDKVTNGEISVQLVRVSLGVYINPFIVDWLNWKIHVCTRGSFKWLKKSSKEVLSREGVCMRLRDCSTSNWLENLDHVSKLRDGSFFQYLELNFSSNFEPSQSFRSGKVSHLGVVTRDRDF